MKKQPERNARTQTNIEQAPGLQGYQSYQSYQSNTRPMTPKTKEATIKSIGNLDSEQHKHIYALMRNNGMPAKFFARSSRTTHFDFSKLPNKLMWQLNAHVKMLQENNQRQDVINKSADQHREAINRVKLSLKPTSQHSLQNSNTVGQSERERYQKMLQMQRS